MRLLGSRALRGAGAAALATVVIAGTVTLSDVPAALALPPAGTDVLPVTAQVSVTTVLGSETLNVSGTATIVRGAPYLQGGVEVEDAEATAMSLSGTSVTGSVTITESATKVSPGRLQTLQLPPPQYPATGYFDLYVVIQAPASPSPTITLHNDAALHLVPLFGSFSGWPPPGSGFGATPNPCVPLLPTQPMHACITAITVGFGGGAVGGIAELAPPRVPQGTPTSAPAVGVVAAAILSLGAIVFFARRRLTAH